MLRDRNEVENDKLARGQAEKHKHPAGGWGVAAATHGADFHILAVEKNAIKRLVGENTAREAPISARFVRR